MKRAPSVAGRLYLALLKLFHAKMKVRASYAIVRGTGEPHDGKPGMEAYGEVFDFLEPETRERVIEYLNAGGVVEVAIPVVDKVETPTSDRFRVLAPLVLEMRSDGKAGHAA